MSRTFPEMFGKNKSEGWKDSGERGNSPNAFVGPGATSGGRRRGARFPFHVYDAAHCAYRLLHARNES